MTTIISMLISMQIGSLWLVRHILNTQTSASSYHTSIDPTSIDQAFTTDSSIHVLVGTHL